MDINESQQNEIVSFLEKVVDAYENTASELRIYDLRPLDGKRLLEYYKRIGAEDLLEDESGEPTAKRALIQSGGAIFCDRITGLRLLIDFVVMCVPLAFILPGLQITMISGFISMLVKTLPLKNLAAQKIIDIITSVYSETEQKFETFKEFITNEFGTSLPVLRGVLAPVLLSGLSAFNNFLGMFQNYFTSLGSSARSQTINSMFSKLLTKSRTIISKIDTVATPVLNTSADIFTELLTSIENLLCSYIDQAVISTYSKEQLRETLINDFNTVYQKMMTDLENSKRDLKELKQVHKNYNELLQKNRQQLQSLKDVEAKTSDIQSNKNAKMISSLLLTGDMLKKKIMNDISSYEKQVETYNLLIEEAEDNKSDYQVDILNANAMIDEMRRVIVTDIPNMDSIQGGGKSKKYKKTHRKVTKKNKRKTHRKRKTRRHKRASRNNSSSRTRNNNNFKKIHYKPNHKPNHKS